MGSNKNPSTLRHASSTTLNDIMMANDKNEKSISNDSIITGSTFPSPSTDEIAPEQEEFIDGDTRAWLIVAGSWVHEFQSFVYNLGQSLILSYLQLFEYFWYPWVRLYSASWY